MEEEECLGGGCNIERGRCVLFADIHVAVGGNTSIASRQMFLLIKYLEFGASKR